MHNCFLRDKNWVFLRVPFPNDYNIKTNPISQWTKSLATVMLFAISIEPSLPQKPKGQIISECPYEIIVYPKIATKKIPRFLPWPLRRGQTKNFIKPIMLNNP